MAKGLSTAKQDLYGKSGDGFHILVVALFGQLLHPLSNSKRMGVLDSLGIDAFATDINSGKYEIVIQCKGFEVPVFGSEQQKQCLQEIEKYRTKGPPTQCYQLVLNRFVEGDYRRELLKKLEELVGDKKVAKAELLDLSKLLQRIDFLAGEKISVWARTSGEKTVSDYNERLSGLGYISSVPFLSSGHAISDPSKFIVGRITQTVRSYKKDQTSRNRPTTGILVTSSFGFGKTRTLHQVSRELAEQRLNVILLPAAVLDPTFFSNVSGLTISILKAIMPDEEEFDKLTMRILRDALKKTLIRSTNFILIIDGLDEHPSAYKSTSLYRLWRSIKDLGTPFVISARDELVDIREREFSGSVQQEGSQTFERLQLLEWSDDLIIKYLDAFRQFKTGGNQIEFDSFVGGIKKSGYRETYGDIPERPLFLNMLAEDAWSGIEPSRKLHVLYENYFVRKFTRDVEAGVAGKFGGRPSLALENLGVDESIFRLLEMMTNLSKTMLVLSKDGDYFLHREVFSEQEVLVQCDVVNLPKEFFEEILMHSLLLPAGRDQKLRHRLARFAHKSFQDWFTARSLIDDSNIQVERLQPAVAKFLVAMRAK